MKKLTKFALAAAILASAGLTANAQWGSGYCYSTTTAYPCSGYSAYTPSYSSSYTTHHYTPSYASSYTTYSYTPSYSYGSGSSSYSGSYSLYGSSTRIGGTTFHNYSSSTGGYLSGTTIRTGNTAYTSLYGW
jgi:hypothetical protein